jgi:hypothetical protein
MEIKILCPCGTKYKFDVEPVNGRMPWPVNCPACNADGTPQANEIIAQTPAANQPTAAAFVPPPPTAAPLPAAPPSLKVNRPAPAPFAPSSSAAAPAPFTVVHSEPVRDKRALWKTAVVILVICVGAGSYGYKWYRRIRAVVHAAVAVHQMQTTLKNGAIAQQNLQADNQVILYVRHTNSAEVVQECITFWKEKLHRDLKTLKPDQQGQGDNEIAVLPPHNGYVRVMGSLEWKEREFEAVAQDLSQKFGTLVFADKDVDFSGAYVFGVFDQGVKKFHARMDVAVDKDNEPQETVKTEGNDWALAHGYNPGPDGFKAFNQSDADELTKKSGMRMWDEQEGESKDLVVLQDPQMTQAEAQVQ